MGSEFARKGFDACPREDQRAGQIVAMKAQYIANVNSSGPHSRDPASFLQAVCIYTVVYQSAM